MSEKQYITLTQLSERIAQVIQTAFADEWVWLVAEVSGHKYYANSERHYFDLVEKVESSNTETSKMKAKAWTDGARRIAEFERRTGQAFQNGLQVLIQVRVEYHVVYGLSLTLVDIDEAYTLGNLEKQRLATIEKLIRDNPNAVWREGEELMTANRQLSLPSVMQRLALIASPNSEGYVDFMHTIENNAFGYSFQVDMYRSAVQGADAEREIVAALIQIYESKKQYDAVFIIRGGGAKTDFLVFDTYSVCRAIARFPMPVITGIGHHKDVSIADMMANTSTKTPTKSAEMVVAHNRAFEEELLGFQRTILIHSQQWISALKRHLGALNNSIVHGAKDSLLDHVNALKQIRESLNIQSMALVLKKKQDLAVMRESLIMRPTFLIKEKRQRLSDVYERVPVHAIRFIQSRDTQLQQMSSLIRMLGPKATLRRGFAILMKGDEVVIQEGQIQEGEKIAVRMHEFSIEARIEKIEKHGRESEL